jgi:hypothetical protein
MLVLLLLIIPVYRQSASSVPPSLYPYPHSILLTMLFAHSQRHENRKLTPTCKTISPVNGSAFVICSSSNYMVVRPEQGRMEAVMVHHRSHIAGTGLRVSGFLIRVEVQSRQ